jgi:nitrogen regulatory protein PII
MGFLFKLLKESLRDVLPVVAVFAVFQFFVIGTVPENLQSIGIGLLFVVLGLAIFLEGLEIGIFPIGQSIANDFSKHSTKIWVLIFGFLIGFGTTIAEPALFVIAQKAELISGGRIETDILRLVVAGSVGFALLIGIYRILKGHPIHYYIIAGYILVLIVTFFSPKEIVGLAYDLGGVTTSTVTVPLVAALGIGLAMNIKGRNPVIDGFGLIAFASLTPMIFVQIYGIFVYNFSDAVVVDMAQDIVAFPTPTLSLDFLADGLISSIVGIVPILAIIIFFQFVILRKNVENAKNVIFGFFLVIVGLSAFVLGLEMGLFGIGETMAKELTQKGSNTLIYIFSFAIGFSTTMAEPALLAIAKKSKEISDGKINDFILRLFVSLGVAVGITLGAYRIIEGGNIHYYAIVGYAFVILFTFLSPKYIIPIAYDSGGVTTSTVTVPLVAAIGIGLASNIDGRNPLIDGFGLIAFASLFPMITVMLYGIITQKFKVKSDADIESANIVQQGIHQATKTMHMASGSKQPALEDLGTLFSIYGVIAIVPKDKRNDAIDAAREAGATGATVINAQGLHLDQMDNIFRVKYEESDCAIIYLLPKAIVESVVTNISNRLHIHSTKGSGIIFTFPISSIDGMSQRQEDAFAKAIIKK